jgi:hypothetical protein
MRATAFTGGAHMSEFVHFEVDEGTGVGTIRLDRPR